MSIENTTTNLTLITSVINPQNKPLSYINTRNVYTYEERLSDTFKTIESVKKYIPNNRIFLIECSSLAEQDEKRLRSILDMYINLCDQPKIVEMTSSRSKSMGEGIMTIEAFKYLIENNISYTNLFKISGRYWLNENFNYELYAHHEQICIHRIQNIYENVFTCFYKLPKKVVNLWYNFLLQSLNDFENCVGYEIIFGKFINTLPAEDNEKVEIKRVGINGYVSVAREFIDM